MIGIGSIQTPFTPWRARRPLNLGRTGALAMITKRQLAGLGLGAAVVAVSACAPTIRLEVAPIQIYAKLDADVRVRLDQELQQLLQENPNLF